MPAGLLRELAAIVGNEFVKSAPGELLAYSHDATPLLAGRADVVVLPRTTAEVAGVVRLAMTVGVPVIARGGGSNLCGATVPLQGGIVLGTSRMNTIREVNAAELLARVEPGVPTAALSERVAGAGLLFAPDPGSRTVSTIGGNVATSAGGLRGLKYGTMRDAVLGLEAVLGTGEVIRTGGRLVKDVAGYDLTRLLTGSEGTLAVITEITVALRPLPASSSTGIAYFDDLETAGDVVGTMIAAGILPATLEFLDADCIQAVEAYAHLGLRTDAGALLLFGDDGHPAAVTEHLSTMADLARTGGALHVEVASDAAGAEALLSARRCSLPALSRLGNVTMLEDASVPRPHIAEMVGRIREAANKHSVRIATFGHAGDGNLHPTAVLPDASDRSQQAAEGAFRDIFAAALELGGTITGEHGVGTAKLPYLEKQVGPEQMALMRRLKAAFDPAGILNPGRLGS